MKEVLVNKMKRINKLYRMVLIGALSLCLCTSPAFAQESGSSEENSSMVSESSFEVYCTAEGTEDPTVPAEDADDMNSPESETDSLGTVRVEDGLQYGEDGRLYYYENGVPVMHEFQVFFATFFF